MCVSVYIYMYINAYTNVSIYNKLKYTVYKFIFNYNLNNKNIYYFKTIKQLQLKKYCFIFS